MFSLEELNKQSTGFIKKPQQSKEIVVSNKSALTAMKQGKLVNSESVDHKVTLYTSNFIDESAEILRNSSSELVFLIDRSGSTRGLEAATCAGYNNLIAKEKQTGFKTKITTILFEKNAEIVTFREPVRNCQNLSYWSNGGTRLYDALGDAISEIKSAQNGDDVKHTIFYIMTDGLDKDSEKYSKETIRKMIKERQAAGWKFLFLGAIANAKYIASDLGIDIEASVEIEKTHEGMYNSFISASNALDDLRNYGKLTANWANASRKNNSAISSETPKQLGLK